MNKATSKTTSIQSVSLLSFSLKEPPEWWSNGLGSAPPSDLVQADEGGRADVVSLEEFDTLDRRLHGVHHNVVQGTAGRANGYVILVINTA